MTGYAFTDRQLDKIETFFGEEPRIGLQLEPGSHRKKEDGKVIYTAKHENSPIQFVKEVHGNFTEFTVTLQKEDGWEWYDYDNFREMMEKARKIQHNMDRYV